MTNLFMPKKLNAIIGLTITLLNFFIQYYLYAAEYKTDEEEVVNISEIKERTLVLSRALFMKEGKGWQSNDDIRASKMADSIISGFYKNSFRRFENDYMNLGLTDSYYWFKIFIENDSSSHLSRFLKIESQELVDIHVFVALGDSITAHFKSGRQIPVSLRPYYSINHIFPIELPPHSKSTVLIRIYSPLVLWMTLHTSQSLIEEEYKELILITLFYGIFIAIFFYNAFLAITLKDKTYLYYLGHALSLGIFFFITNGFIPLLIPSLINISPKLILTSVEVSVLFYLLFTSAFLETRKSMPKIDKLIIYSIPLFVFSSFSWTILDYHSAVMYLIQPLSTVYLIIIMGVSIYAVIKGYKSARMFLYGTLFYQTGALITGLVYTGRLPLNFFTFHAAQFGFTCELLFLSFALGDKMKLLKKEKDEVEFREMELQRNFSRRVLESQEEERKRIAGALHDSIGQNFIIIKNWTEIAIKKMKEGLSPFQQLDEIYNISTNAAEEVRTIARNLHPYQLEQIGLKSSIEIMVKLLTKKEGLSITSSIDYTENLFSKEKEVHIYRIVQEAFNNIIKHSKADKVQIIFGINENIDETNRKENLNLLLQITDNGIGFDTKKLFEKNYENIGFGLSGIRERARILGAKLTIQSEYNKGTTINLIIPVYREEFN